MQLAINRFVLGWAMPTICLAIIYSVQFSLVFHNRSQSRLGLKKLSNYQLIDFTRIVMLRYRGKRVFLGLKNIAVRFVLCNGRGL